MRHRTNDQTRQPQLLPHLISLTWFGFVAVAVVYGLLGQTMLEKTLTALTSPCGLVWLLLIAIGFWLWRSGQRRTAGAVFSAWLILTLAGNVWVSYLLMNTLESPWRPIDGILGKPYDVVVVLGGGTSQRNSGRAQLTFDGERVVTAARMYHGGKAKRIVCTGKQVFLAAEDDLHSNEEAAQILTELGVPSESIKQLEGINTSEEMRQLRAWLETQPSPKPQVGIITSAYHLSRAMRLAAANGIEADPVPANFRAIRVTAAPSWIIPDGKQLANTTAALKEFLATAVGR